MTKTWLSHWPGTGWLAELQDVSLRAALWMITVQNFSFPVVVSKITEFLLCWNRSLLQRKRGYCQKELYILPAKRSKVKKLRHPIQWYFTFMMNVTLSRSKQVLWIITISLFIRSFPLPNWLLSNYFERALFKNKNRISKHRK